MPTKKSDKRLVTRWNGLSDALAEFLPELSGVLGDEENFVDLKIKLMPDRTALSVLRRHGADGGIMVCFGSGYGVAGCLLAINNTVESGRWRPDRTWEQRGKDK